MNADDSVFDLMILARFKTKAFTSVID